MLLPFITERKEEPRGEDRGRPRPSARSACRRPTLPPSIPRSLARLLDLADRQSGVGQQVNESREVQSGSGGLTQVPGDGIKRDPDMD